MYIIPSKKILFSVGWVASGAITFGVLSPCNGLCEILICESH